MLCVQKFLLCGLLIIHNKLIKIQYNVAVLAGFCEVHFNQTTHTDILRPQPMFTVYIGWLVVRSPKVSMPGYFTGHVLLLTSNVAIS